ncbi:MAG TPA: hypothetical protein VEJ18_06905, partial [Planctomycetota bacterium]|nr:hypothetical protein [Planctomycetota bacterium]
MKPMPLVLFLDRDPSWSRPLRADLRRRGVLTATASSEQELCRLVSGPAPDACVLSESMVDAEGGPMKPLLAVVFPGTPVISTTFPVPSDVERRRVGSAIDRLLVGRLDRPTKPRP